MVETEANSSGGSADPSGELEKYRNRIITYMDIWNVTRSVFQSRSSTRQEVLNDAGCISCSLLAESPSLATALACSPTSRPHTRGQQQARPY